MYDVGLKGSLGIQMRLVLPISLRSHLVRSLHLIILVITRKEILWTRILEAGKVKEIGKRNGEKHMPEKGSLRCLLSMLTGFHQSLPKKRTITRTFYDGCFSFSVNSGKVEPIKGIPRSISVGQVVWSPNSNESAQYLVFAGWLGDKRKFGIKYCYNRPCAIYAIKFISDEPK